MYIIILYCEKTNTPNKYDSYNFILWNYIGTPGPSSGRKQILNCKKTAQKMHLCNGSHTGIELEIAVFNPPVSQLMLQHFWVEVKGKF